MHDTGTHRRGDASVFRSAPRRDGTPARSGSAIVTREASPGPFAYFIDQGMGVASGDPLGWVRLGGRRLAVASRSCDGCYAPTVAGTGGRGVPAGATRPGTQRRGARCIRVTKCV